MRTDSSISSLKEKYISLGLIVGLLTGLKYLINDFVNFLRYLPKENTELKSLGLCFFQFSESLTFGGISLVIVGAIGIFLTFFRKNFVKPVLIGMTLFVFFLSLFVTIYLYPNSEIINSLFLMNQNHLGSQEQSWWYFFTIIEKKDLLFLEFLLTEIMIVIFWILVNQTITFKEATWIYPSLFIFYFIGNSIGWLVSFITKIFCFDNIDLTFYLLRLSISLFFLMICFAIHFLTKNLNRNEKQSNQSETNTQPLSFNINYLFCIAVMIFSYGLWTKYVKMLSAYMTVPVSHTNYLDSFTYLFEILLACIFGGLSYRITRKHGWYYAARIVPIFYIILFPIFILWLGKVVQSQNVTLVIGTFIRGFIYGTSWTLFLWVKELLYVPLPAKTKARGKILIELIIPMGLLQNSITWNIEKVWSHLLVVIVWFFWVKAIKRLNELNNEICSQIGLNHNN